MTVPERTASEEFLRLREPPRRRRRASPAVLLVRILLRAFILLAPPIALASWIVRTGSLEVRELNATGMQRVTQEWVQARLAPELGRNLVALPLDRVQARLGGHPWIAKVVVDKELPHGLQVSIEERQAVAVLESRGSLMFVDEEGRRIAPVGRGESLAGYVRLRAADTGDGPSPAMELAETRCLRRAIELDRSLRGSVATLPGWLSQLEGIEVVGDDDFRLYSRSLSFPVLVRSADGVDRARALGGLMSRIRGEEEAIREIDLRFRGQVIVRRGEAADWEQFKET